MYDIYSNSRGDAWRFALGRSGTNPLLAVGLNPSTATRDKADPTVAKVERVAERAGYNGFVMLNLYPVRATDYRALPATANKEAFETNLRKIEELVATLEMPTIWAAWGNCVGHHGYFAEARDELFRRLERYRAQWVCFGPPTGQGHPRHPSRLQYAWEFRPYTQGR